MSHIYTELFNCGLALIDCISIFICIYGMYLLSGSFDTEVYIWVYIWKYLDYNLEPIFFFCIFTCGVGLK